MLPHSTVNETTTSPQASKFGHVYSVLKRTYLGCSVNRSLVFDTSMLKSRHQVRYIASTILPYQAVERAVALSTKIQSSLDYKDSTSL